MKSKKSILTILVLAVLMILTGCEFEFRSGYRAGYTALAPISGVEYDYTNIMWTYDKNVDKYELVFVLDGFTYRRESYSNSYPMFRESELRRPRDGVYNIRIRAVSESGKFKSSEWVELTYTVSGRTLEQPLIRTGGGRLVTWDEVSGAQSFEMKITTESKTTAYTLAAGTTSFMLNIHESNAPLYYIELTAIGDGNYYLTSETASVIYDARMGKYRLREPQNARMEGDMLVWDKVYLADYYEITDIMGNRKVIRDNFYDCSTHFYATTINAINSMGTFQTSFNTTDIVFFSEGDGTELDPFIIRNYSEFRYIDFMETTTDLTSQYHYRLEDDIELVPLPDGETELSNIYMIQSFGGVLDGNGKTISGLEVNFTKGAWAMFKIVRDDAVITNLHIADVDIKVVEVPDPNGINYPMGLSASIFAYINYGTISGCSVTGGSIYGHDDAVAVASYNYGVIEDIELEDLEISAEAAEAAGVSIALVKSGARVGSIARVNVTNCTILTLAVRPVGGIAAVVQSGTAISDCHIVGGIITSPSEVGGIAGYSGGNITNCSNSALVGGTLMVGGIVGKLGEGGIISGCANTGDITGMATGEIRSMAIGGIAGFVENGTLRTCTNSGTIYGHDSVGLLFGLLDIGDTSQNSPPEGQVVVLGGLS